MSRTDEFLQQIETQMGGSWLARIYRERILKMRTRAYHFPALSRRSQPEIHHTLLGIELKAGSHRMLCPDLATARYLAVFVRIGAGAVAVPYDITTISAVADQLESSWHRMLLLADELTKDESAALRTRFRRQLIGKVSAEIANAGPGRTVPEFRQSTRQKIEPRKDTKSTN